MNTDYFLDYLTEQWTNVEDAIASWPQWSSEDRDAFMLDWVVPEERLSLLKEHIRHHGLNANQVERYVRLSKLIEKNSPSLYGGLMMEYAVIGGCGRAPVRFREGLPVPSTVEQAPEVANLPPASSCVTLSERIGRLKADYRRLRSGGNSLVIRRAASPLFLLQILSR